MPVPDGYTWQDFLQQVPSTSSLPSRPHVQGNTHYLSNIQVQQKLKLTTVESIVLASVSLRALSKYAGACAEQHVYQFYM